MKRTAEKAGTWYDSDANKLRTKLTNWINEATSSRTINTNKTSIRAIIAPHAGYKFSGPVAAYAYEQIIPSQIQRIFLLGPAHYRHITSCCVSKAKYCETPLGDIECDREIVKELKDTGEFQEMSIEMDSEEHSIELHLPYIYHVMQGHPFKLVHILVGSLNDQREEAYGKIFSKYLTDPNNLFVISSDFCHWGERFSYQPFSTKKGQIFQYIEEMDREGIAAIEKQDVKLFKEYLSTTKNTICGKKPIAVLLHAIAHSKANFDMKLVDYAQSNSCKNRSDSSVSYASLVLIPSEDSNNNNNNINNINNNSIHSSDHRSNGAIFGE